VGRHAADDGAAVDPIIEAALRHRSAAGTADPRHASRSAATSDDEGGLGWPGEPGDGTGLGWPTGSAVHTGTPTAHAPSAPVPEEPAVRRRGWRRLFGGAVESSRTTAA